MKVKLMSKTMRTVTMLLLSAMVISCGLLHRTADDIIDDMRDARNAEYINVGSGLLGLGRLLSPTLAEANLGISSIEVLDLSKCNVNVRDKFRNRINDLYKNRYYEEIVTKQGSYDSYTALVHSDGQFVDELVIARASDMKDMIVLIRGHIRIQDVERIANDQHNYFNR